MDVGGPASVLTWQVSDVSGQVSEQLHPVRTVRMVVCASNIS